MITDDRPDLNIRNQNEELAQNLRSLQTSVSAGASAADSNFAILASQSRTAADDLQAIVKKNAVDLGGLQDSIAHDLSSIEQQLSATEGAVHSTGQVILAELSMISYQLKQKAANTTAGVKSTQVAKGVLMSLPPATLKQALDAYSDCQCQSGTTGSTTSSFDVYNFRVFYRQQNLSRHERGCPLHAVTKGRRTTVGARARLRLGSFLSGLIEANFWCSTGAGAASFGPSVSWKSVVPWRQSLVQREFSRIYMWLKASDRNPSAVEVVDQLAKLRRNIIMLYTDGGASINDVDESSKNHLQVCLRRDQYHGGVCQV